MPVSVRVTRPRFLPSLVFTEESRSVGGRGEVGEGGIANWPALTQSGWQSTVVGRKVTASGYERQIFKYCPGTQDRQMVVTTHFLVQVTPFRPRTSPMDGQPPGIGFARRVPSMANFCLDSRKQSINRFNGKTDGQEPRFPKYPSSVHPACCSKPIKEKNMDKLIEISVSPLLTALLTGFQLEKVMPWIFAVVVVWMALNYGKK